jgi:pyridoxine 5-phosphate synthase
MLGNPLRLGVNIDHVATLRNARGGTFPCPVEAAKIARKAGADGITAHLREDRRHIRDADIIALKQQVALPLNFEMAATSQMQQMALKIMPNAVCIVPESRAELTTEGGLDVAGQRDKLREFIAPLKQAGIRISLFVDASEAQINSCHEVGADIIELHTGHYCEMIGEQQEEAFEQLQFAARYAHHLGIECHAGHGLNYHTAQEIATIAELVELNIGHFLISDAVFIGLEAAIHRMKQAMAR